MKLDLHIHTYMSDGHASPTEVVNGAVSAGIDVIAIADHDTAAGVEEARKAAGGTQLRVIPGIEVSTSHEDNDIHILGYWINPRSQAIQEHQANSAQRRQDRMRAMVAKLQDLGVPVTYDEVVREAGVDTRSIGRPHLARVLLAGGHIRYYGEAFERYLRDGGPVVGVQHFPSVREGIRMIHDAGGVAVWAHPRIELFDSEIGHFVEWDLDGVECFRPYYPVGYSMHLEITARNLGLLRTGGSDWHGPHRGPLGEFHVRRRDVADFLEWGLRRSKLRDFAPGG